MKNAILTLCRIGFGLVFIYASLDKIAHPALFQEAVMNYRILPDTLTSLTAAMLPWLEFVCGMALAANIFPRGAALILNALMAVFLAALAYNLYRGLDIHCGCFTTDPTAETNMPLSFARDLFIFAMGWAALFKAFADQRRSKTA